MAERRSGGGFVSGLEIGARSSGNGDRDRDKGEEGDKREVHDEMGVRTRKMKNIRHGKKTVQTDKKWTTEEEKQKDHQGHSPSQQRV